LNVGDKDGSDGIYPVDEEEQDEVLRYLAEEQRQKHQMRQANCLRDPEHRYFFVLPEELFGTLKGALSEVEMASTIVARRFWPIGLKKQIPKPRDADMLIVAGVRQGNEERTTYHAKLSFEASDDYGNEWTFEGKTYHAVGLAHKHPSGYRPRHSSTDSDTMRKGGYVLSIVLNEDGTEACVYNMREKNCGKFRPPTRNTSVVIGMEKGLVKEHGKVLDGFYVSLDISGIKPPECFLYGPGPCDYVLIKSSIDESKFLLNQLFEPGPPAPFYFLPRRTLF
jgi:hypothetical protein